MSNQTYIRNSLKVQTDWYQCNGVESAIKRRWNSLRTSFMFRRSDTRQPSSLFSLRVESAHLLLLLTQISQKSTLNMSLIPANANNNKKAVLSQRWPRDARYISRSWAVTEIWPFEIIQDGSGRHLEFIRIEYSAIRSAVPENPTL